MGQRFVGSSGGLAGNPRTFNPTHSNSNAALGKQTKKQTEIMAGTSRRTSGTLLGSFGAPSLVQLLPKSSNDTNAMMLHCPCRRLEALQLQPRRRPRSHKSKSGLGVGWNGHAGVKAEALTLPWIALALAQCTGTWFTHRHAACGAGTTKRCSFPKHVKPESLWPKALLDAYLGRLEADVHAEAAEPSMPIR